MTGRVLLLLVALPGVALAVPNRTLPLEPTTLGVPVQPHAFLRTEAASLGNGDNTAEQGTIRSPGNSLPDESVNGPLNDVQPGNPRDPADAAHPRPVR